MKFLFTRSERRCVKFISFFRSVYLLRQRAADYLLQLIVIIKTSVVSGYLIAEQLECLCAVYAFGQNRSYVCMSFPFLRIVYPCRHSVCRTDIGLKLSFLFPFVMQHTQGVSPATHAEFGSKASGATGYTLTVLGIALKADCAARVIPADMGDNIRERYVHICTA